MTGYFKHAFDIITETEAFSTWESHGVLPGRSIWIDSWQVLFGYLKSKTSLETLLGSPWVQVSAALRPVPGSHLVDRANPTCRPLAVEVCILSSANHSGRMKLEIAHKAQIWQPIEAQWSTWIYWCTVIECGHHQWLNQKKNLKT